MGNKGSDLSGNRDKEESDLSGIEYFDSYGYIPVNCLHRIFSFLPLEHLCDIMSTCRCFYMVSNTQLFWKELHGIYRNGKDQSLTERTSSNTSTKSTEPSTAPPKTLKSFYFDERDSAKFKFIADGIKTKKKSKFWKPKNEDYDTMLNKNICCGDDDFDRLLKIVFLGECGAGRSVYLHKLSSGEYQMVPSTIGVDFMIRTASFGNKKYKLQIWDTAGQERFQTITKSYYKGADGVVIFTGRSFGYEKGFICRRFDEGTLDHNTKEYKKICDEFGMSCRVVFAGTKSDIPLTSESEYEIMGKYIARVGGTSEDFVEFSSCNDENFWCPLGRIIEKIVDDL